MRRPFDYDEWHRHRYRHYGDASALWQNKEALDKYLKRLAELMAEDGDESAKEYLSLKNKNSSESPV